jgi:hypothetical protein
LALNFFSKAIKATLFLKNDSFVMVLPVGGSNNKERKLICMSASRISVMVDFFKTLLIGILLFPLQ